MGNDGGSIPTRRELTKTAKRDPTTTELKATQLESQTHAWTQCPLSHRALSSPIVSDSLGALYNKDAVIELLLPSTDSDAPARTEQEELIARRIKSLRDVVQVSFQTEIDLATKEDKKVCPVTSKELGPTTKAVYLVPCGHAFSALAIKEVAGDTCMVCNEPYTLENIISMLPLVKEDFVRLEERARRLKEAGLTHSLKKAPGSKKKKERKHAEVSTTIESKTTLVAAEALSEKNRKRLVDTQDVDIKANSASAQRSAVATPLGGIKNAATASLTARVLYEQEERNKRRKLGLNDNLKGLFSKPGANGQAEKRTDFMTRGFTVPKNASH